VGIVHAATATGLAPAADHVPVTRAQVQVLIQAIHPAHGHHLYPDAGDHQAFWIGGVSQAGVVGIPGQDPLLPVGVAVIQGHPGLQTRNGILINPGKKKTGANL